MSSQEIPGWLQSEGSDLVDTTIVGTPIESRGKTLIPLAMPGDSGWASRLRFWTSNDARPMGFLVVSDTKTRFVKVQDRRWLLLGLILGAIALILVIASVGLKVQKSRQRKPALW